SAVEELHHERIPEGVWLLPRKNGVTLVRWRTRGARGDSLGQTEDGQQDQPRVLPDHSHDRPHREPPHADEVVAGSSRPSPGFGGIFDAADRMLTAGHPGHRAVPSMLATAGAGSLGATVSSPAGAGIAPG